MEKPKVYVTRKLMDQVMEYLNQHCTVKVWDGEETAPRAVVEKEIREVEGLLTVLSVRVDEQLLDLNPGLKIVSNMAVGFDNINVSAATARGVMVGNTPGVLTETTADVAWALMMAAARRVVEGDKLTRSGGWEAWSPLFMCGQDVYGTTLGIVGLGRIGMAMARRAKGFGMKVLYTKRNRDLEAEKELGLEYVSMEQLLKDADYVSIHCPLTPETTHLFGEREFNKMKPTAILVNTSRGPVIDEAALFKALKERKIWAAGLDVFEKEPVDPNHPLLTLDNLVVTPHIGSATISTRTKMAMRAAENLVQGVTGHVPKYLVNPEYEYNLK
ncbi:MAG TPA: D-glycerate dehydrogenase [Verrucomicrobiae bacterium]|nr:D-glycerate dehydrogenase [Verrucomicrobiae bacterium]